MLVGWRVSANTPCLAECGGMRGPPLTEAKVCLKEHDIDRGIPCPMLHIRDG
jgi:hypothetical protein